MGGGGCPSITVGRAVLPTHVEAAQDERIGRRIRHLQTSQVPELVTDVKERIYSGSLRDSYGGLRTPTYDAWAREQEKTDQRRCCAFSARLDRGVRFHNCG